MKNLQGVFLDFYGTLASGDRLAVESICQMVIDDHGITALDAPSLASNWGDQFFAAIEAVDGTGFRLLVDIERDTLIETIAPYVGTVEVDVYIERFNAYMVQPTLFEEVAEVLAGLSVPTCIVSNADERELRAAIAHHDLAVDHIVSSESARSYKPEPSIFDHALELTGWSRDRVIHVGDSLHSDVDGARRAGITAAWVNRVDRIKDIGTAVPDHEWPDLRPLLAMAGASDDQAADTDMPLSDIRASGDAFIGRGVPGADDSA